MKRTFTIIVILFSALNSAWSQIQYLPYSYQVYQKFDVDLYSTGTREFTATKPYFLSDSLLKHHYDSLMNYGNDGKQHSWAHNKLFNEHLIDIKNAKSAFYADFLPDFDIGHDLSNKQNTNITSIGLQAGGSVGNKFYYNIAGYRSSEVFPEYVSTYINQTGIVPGQAQAYLNGGNNYYWSYVTALVSYTPNKYLNISAGRDKTFIGDGYRSMFLSDYASPYPFLKLTGTLGNVRYMVLYAFFNDPRDESITGNAENKYGVFHYLDWNVSNRLSLGFFDSIIWGNSDLSGHYRGFDFSYLSPVIFLRTLEASNGSPDNALLGFTGKYKISNGVTLYGQFALDEFIASEFFSSDGSFRNKYGWQLGIRGTNLFSVKGLNYLLETNNVKPYTYSERGGLINYTENGEPLAQPWGGNLREVVGLLNYSYKRFDFSAEADYGYYGLDVNGLNYGKNPFDDYTSPAQEFGNVTGQGLTTKMTYFEGKVAYLINPKYNLRIELGAIMRDEKNSVFNDKTNLFTIGLRSSFRDVYNDLASYRSH